jgi:cytochrome c biogenesis protein CcdA
MMKRSVDMALFLMIFGSTILYVMLGMFVTLLSQKLLKSEGEYDNVLAGIFVFFWPPIFIILTCHALIIMLGKIYNWSWE